MGDTVGMVIKNTGSWYTVLTDGGSTVDCKIKGNFRLKGIRSTNPVAVGDRVEIIRNQEGTAFITSICDRKNYIIRKSSNLSKQSHIIAANVDQAFLIVTVDYPQTSTTFIDRFLASAEAYNVPVTIIFNKVDLFKGDEERYLDMMVNLYETVGYTCLKVSAETEEGLQQLLPLLEGKITLFSGNSGVGKSTLLNKIVPGGTAHGGDFRRTQHRHAHYHIQRDAEPRRRRMGDRHTRNKRLRHVQYGTRRDLRILQGDIPVLERLPLQQLHTHT